jgi:hypothetical protein
MTVTDPWSGMVETVYWPDNMYNSDVYRGLMGTVSDVFRDGEWDWCIEVFVGSIWVYCKGDFDSFVQMLYEVWLEEFLHMVYRWEWFSSQDFQLNPALIDEEKPVREWVRLLTEF